MASSGFQFKAFYVQHDQCAMKVGTDSIILGSWLDTAGARNCLDIGTGSGLLALMLAQKTASLTHAEIVAIEPDDLAFWQARHNFSQSPWSNKIKAQHVDLQHFVAQTSELIVEGTKRSHNRPHAFDLIVSNPPYYAAHQPNERDNNVLSMPDSRKRARQSNHLTLRLLIESVSQLLCETGRFYCVLPVQSQTELEQVVCQYGLTITQRLDIQTTSIKAIKRQCWCIQKKREGLIVKCERLTIHQDDGDYSEAFKRLCQAFYLAF
ncbi:tRNA1(Val) (adenine(37)-N6)-methyltransferase [Alteromonas sp. a30]|uniref:tRNA1(Val) (adenine(37)-N6)-methyltransferase n=1 Tax=Alteromonas sp. a30 TaxID=2730917 RepID=UPI0022816ED6|nr:methyltransferase [Alteromonas sp. a30]MCY7294303.1 methyltransferase [Alteromonas sp. a30]